MKSEKDFLQELEGRVVEQEKILKTGVLPSWAEKWGEWLGINPWRSLIPISLAIYGLMRWWMGEWWREWILKLFGGY